MAVKLMTKVLALVVLLSAVADHSVRAEASTAIVGEAEVGKTSLRQRRGENSQRRLFYWGNLLYTLHVCKDASGWCPEPHCGGPLKPPGCSASSGGSSSGGSSSSSGSSGEGDAQYTDAYAEDGANVAVSEGVDGQTGAGGSTVRTNFLIALVAAAAVASLVGVFLMKKNKSKAEGDDLDHQLSQSVSRRLEKLLEGKSVSPVHNDKMAAPAFIGAGKDAPSVPPSRPRNLDEPDQEAIEMRLDASQLSYVNMGEC